MEKQVAKFNVKILRSILECVYKNIPNTPLIDYMSCFKFTKNYVTTTNGKTQTGVIFKSPIEFTVPGGAFFDLINTIDRDTIFIEKTDGVDELLIYTETKDFIGKINSISKDEIPPIRLPKDGWEVLDDEVVNAMRLCLFSVSKDPSVQAYTGVIFNGDVFSTDRYRISKYTLKEKLREVGNKKISIPDTLVAELLNVNKDGKHIKFTTTDNNILFMTGAVVYITSKLSGDIKDFNKFFTQLTKGIKVVIPPSLASVVKRHMQFQNNMLSLDKSTEIKIERDNIKIRTVNSGGGAGKNKYVIGEVEERIAISPNKEAIGISFIINPELLYAILTQTKTKCEYFEYFKDSNMVKFVSGNFTHIMMLQIVEKE